MTEEIKKTTKKKLTNTEYTRVEGNQEDSRIVKAQEELKLKLEALAKEKVDTKFDENIAEYQVKKKEAKTIKGKLKESNDQDEIKELTTELKNKESEIKVVLSKFKTVNQKEKAVYALKGKIDNLIISIDYRKNTADVKAKKAQYIIEDLEALTAKDALKKLQEENEKTQEVIIELTQEVELIISKGGQASKQSEEVKAAEKKIKENLKLIEKIKNTDKTKAGEAIWENKAIVSEQKALSEGYQDQIEILLGMIKEVNEALTFIDSEEVNHKASFQIEGLNVFYGSKQALFDINLTLPKNKVISIIGPSGCGKSTFLRTLNRINDNIPSFKAKGRILLDGEYDIFKLKSIVNRYDKMELSTLRTKVGMIFQQPNPFPMSIAKNVQYGPKVRGVKNKAILNELTEQALQDAGIWEEVKDNLKALGTSLSGGQQQRLCIARAIANQPEILLMDEPTSALDPIAAKKIEDLILKLKKDYTIIMVTHSMQQAQRISDFTAFFYQGELIEYGKTKQVFESPKEKQTQDYISGKFG